MVVVASNTQVEQDEARRRCRHRGAMLAGLAADDFDWVHPGGVNRRLDCLNEAVLPGNRVQGRAAKGVWVARHECPHIHNSCCVLRTVFQLPPMRLVQASDNQQHSRHGGGYDRHPNCAPTAPHRLVAVDAKNKRGRCEPIYYRCGYN